MDSFSLTEKIITAFISFFCLLIIGGASVHAQETPKKLFGRIVLDVQQNGEAWYVKPTDGMRVFMGRPDDAFRVMRELGIGITNENLAKIPLGLITMKMTGNGSIEKGGNDAADTILECKKRHLDRGDIEGFTNCSIASMSTQIGFDVTKDTDSDGFTDAEEILNNYNPYGNGKMPIDAMFTKKHLGKIFLQVESRGEAWYVNPVSGRRYFLGRPTDAFVLMRGFGLGITNDDLKKIKR